ncbi:SGNH/GDSL hydrolase family protein [Deinococcus maricopensis]|uniref:Lipolytic protein G-D-S-L family n=1 Tax=Deinococcus maricopensis (strain DSM 21211 / LMG 22137 / NRRL B-23946 / LB-34) TaxID=709986 RepID=E8U7F8_DEIML|nr:SGNH/GDSL hydrolase family protein [Deinococcus maricopensis]ADV66997.1 lipolytic protein G-D-S-L family [Deinococcus maricopensis DSM 21211]
MRSLLLSLTVLLSSCSLLTPREEVPETVFSRYVAVGDSLTAGMQAGGLTAESQAEAFPVLLAERAGVAMPMPYVRGPGCPPPVTAEVQVASCGRADPNGAVQNFAVPGARVRDLRFTTPLTLPRAREDQPEYTLLYHEGEYRLILGNRGSQLDQAVRARPRFVTLWVGANDVLPATLYGAPERATSPAAFEVEFRRVLDVLGRTGARVVVLTVPDITAVPGFFSVPWLRLARLVDASCDGRDDLTISVLAFRAQGMDKPVSCRGPFALSAAQMARARAAVDGYNAAIERVARGRRNVAVFDVAPFMRSMNGSPVVPSAAAPFGLDYSMDGIHPSGRAHERLALALARFINAEFGTDIPTT